MNLTHIFKPKIGSKKIPKQKHILFIFFCCLFVGCVLGDPDLVQIPIPETCGNGICELETEDCTICSLDCSCCLAVSSEGTEGTIIDSHNAIGPSDNKFALLNGNSVLVLVLGQDAHDQIATADLSFAGLVTSSSSTTSTGCPSNTEGNGAFEVSVSKNGYDWHLVGFWTAQNSDFDLGCAQLIEPSIRYVEVRGQPGATGQLDAVIANSCFDEL